MRRASWAEMLVGLMLFTVGLTAQAQAPQRPNVLVVMTDDQSWPHASAYGSKVARTPAFDRIAASGVRFDNGFVSAPSCGPSRASLLTGQEFYRLGPTSMNHTIWRPGLATLVDKLSAAGYATGYTGKGWAPGDYQAGGRQLSPTGAAFNALTMEQPGQGGRKIDYAGNFDAFLSKEVMPAPKPFFFWVGINEPHRPYAPGVAARNGKRLKAADLPAFLPRDATTLNDVADYAFEIEWADAQLSKILERLARDGQLANTLIVFTSDNGMPFPRAKGQLYDSGAHVPMAVAWPAAFSGGRVVTDFVRMPDLGATILDAAGVGLDAEVTGQTLMPLLRSNRAGRIEAWRDHAVMGMERHFPGSRPDGGGYPSRAIRTAEWLYIRNDAPDRNPAGDPQSEVWPEDDPTGGFGDVDGGPAKTALVAARERDPLQYARAFGKRPAEELYAVRNDRPQWKNLAADPRHQQVKRELAARMDAFLQRTADPRALGRGQELDDAMRRYARQNNGSTAADYGSPK